jgi:hypothetical protein
MALPRPGDAPSGWLAAAGHAAGSSTSSLLSEVEPLPGPNFAHLAHMTDHRGVWEHAEFAAPRVEHGYCTDDNARALIVLGRVQDPTADLIELEEIYLAFLHHAQLPTGGFVNRRNPDGTWSHGIGSDDSQGRAIWALGSIAGHGPTPWMKDIALAMFDAHRDFRSPSPRANAFAVLGAGEVLMSHPDHHAALQVMQRCVGHLGFSDDPSWPWPEGRLAYDNARIPEALLLAGMLLPDDDLIDAGLRLLEWLVAIETLDGHFSFTPTGGWAQGEPRPGFDQQPVEAAAIADACTRAWALTGDRRWKDAVAMAGRWFMGDNDAGLSLYDPLTGGCGDGLGRDYANLNQGAESTLAALSVLQHAHDLR